MEIYIRCVKAGILPHKMRPRKYNRDIETVPFLSIYPNKEEFGPGRKWSGS